jgi:hypothetical protein
MDLKLAMSFLAPTQLELYHIAYRLLYRPPLLAAA